MISAWLDLSVIGIFLSLTIVFGTTAALIVWVISYSPLRARIQGFSGIVAPYFVSVALLFSLLTGFLAGDVFDRFKQAVRAVQIEAGALSNVDALARAATVDARPVHEALVAYLEALVNDEWPRMSAAQPSPKAQAALATLLRALADPKVAPATSAAVHAGLVQLGLQAATARSDRLALNNDHSDDIKWVTVLILCLMTQIAVGMVHLDHARANIAALTVFSIGAIIALGMIAIQEAPFDGALRIPPTQLERLLQAIKT